MMYAFFHLKGTTPSFNDKLNTLATGIPICSTFPFVVLEEINILSGKHWTEVSIWVFRH